MDAGCKEYIRVKRGNKKLVLQVLKIGWENPWTPVGQWVTAKTLETSVDIAELDKEVSDLIRNSKYFGFCSMCQEFNNSGHMHDESVCQGCAERHLGICY